MNTRRTHHVTTTDGVEIGGSIRGQGPPVVLLQGVMGDGHLDWQALRPYLADRFTCYLPSWCGRGLSGDHLDLSYVPLVDDAVAYVDSIGQPTGLVGWSGGCVTAPCGATASNRTGRPRLWSPSPSRSFGRRRGSSGCST